MEKEKFKTMIGGQALIEGIMMMGPDKVATVVRTKKGIKTKTEPRKHTEGFSIRKIPFRRGVRFRADVLRRCLRGG